MGKTKTKSIQKNKRAKADSTEKKVEEEKGEKEFDFGGIPARDLKKNLGCG